MQKEAEPICLLRRPSEKHGGEKPEDIVEAASEEEAAEEDEHILCRQCRKIITHPAEQIQINGAHQHTFANPHGIVYQIGCFGSAMGCGSVGPVTDEFTWFPGYNWQIAVCGSCLTHLGWTFFSGGGGRFYGLILDHLIFPN
jgi:hypothetical protein